MERNIQFSVKTKYCNWFSNYSFDEIKEKVERLNAYVDHGVATKERIHVRMDHTILDIYRFNKPNLDDYEEVMVKYKEVR